VQLIICPQVVLPAQWNFSVSVLLLDVLVSAGGSVGAFVGGALMGMGVGVGVGVDNVVVTEGVDVLVRADVGMTVGCCMVGDGAI